MTYTTCILAGGHKPSIAESAVGMPLASIPIKETLNLLDAWRSTIGTAGFDQVHYLLVSNATSDPDLQHHACDAIRSRMNLQH